MSGIMAGPRGAQDSMRAERASPSAARRVRRKTVPPVISLASRLKRPGMTEAALPVFDAPYAEDDGAIAARLLGEARLAPARERRIDATASGLISAIRAGRHGLGGVEEMLRE